MRTRLSLKIRAGARRTELAGRYGDGWKLSVAARPVDGEANQAIIRFLAKLAGVPAAAVRIVTGASASTKLVEIAGVAPDHLERAMLDSHGPRKNPASSAPAKS
jgi:uncharacterized protein YggU (UPF0235/DUF167 family)